MILQIALDTPLRRVFDYRCPALDPRGNNLAPASLPESLQPGVRVRVPFGRRELVGILVGTASKSSLDPAKLKSALEILDTAPVFDPVTFDLLRWAAEYYHHPLGEVIAAALPASLRTGQASEDGVLSWSLTEAGRAELVAPTDRRGPQQRALLAWFGAREATATPLTAPNTSGCWSGGMEGVTPVSSPGRGSSVTSLLMSPMATLMSMPVAATTCGTRTCLTGCRYSSKTHRECPWLLQKPDTQPCPAVWMSSPRLSTI